jgi:hypothetical protein
MKNAFKKFVKVSGERRGCLFVKCVRCWHVVFFLSLASVMEVLDGAFRIYCVAQMCEETLTDKCFLSFFL